MRVFVTGAGGYIGGSVAARLVAAGHRVVGLVRSEDKAAGLRQRGIEPLLGSLDDANLLADAVRRADAVVNAADSDHRGAVEALIDALAGTGKPLLHTSGTSVVADRAAGEPSDRVFDEDTPFEPVPEKAARVAIDRFVIGAADRGIRSVVLCNSLIYGRGLGLHPDSIQIPMLIRQARESGVPRYVGRGENIWSTVHIEDVADLYLLALERAPAGSFFYVENGEASFRAMVEAISRMLGFGGRAEGWPVDEAIAAWGEQRALFSLGSNSRVRARRARRELGWSPRGPSVFEEIERGCYRLPDGATGSVR